MVALVLGSLGVGGAERMAIQLAKNLDRSRYQVLVVTTRESGPLARDLLEAGVPIVSFDRRRRYSVQAVMAFRRFLADQSIDLVHSFNHFPSYFVALCRILATHKFIHVVHDHHGPVIESAILSLLDSILLRRAGFYITASPELADRAKHVIGIPPDRVEYLANGVEIPKVRSKKRNQIPKIVQVARIHPVKNQLLAIEAACRLRENGCSFEWLLIGRIDNHEYAEMVRRRAESRELQRQVRFLGEQNEVSAFLQGATIGVLTSDAEGLSVAVLEYMSYGLPVVTTDVGETARIVRSSCGGITVPRRDSEAVATAIQTILRSADLQQSFGTRGREYVAEHYSIQGMVDRTMSIYDKAISSTKRF